VRPGPSCWRQGYGAASMDLARLLHEQATVHHMIGSAVSPWWERPSGLRLRIRKRDSGRSAFAAGRSWLSYVRRAQRCGPGDCERAPARPWGPLARRPCPTAFTGDAEHGAGRA
jgi:hypothetical protein